MEIIPAIDIINGKCVRLTQGDYLQKKEYPDDPLTIARQFEKAGIKRLHLVDLDGAKAKKIINRDTLERITKNTGLQVDFGGGVQSDWDIELAFRLGAKQVTGGSIAVRNPDLFQSWIQRYGGDKILLGADVKDRKIAIGGWQETTEIDLIGFIKSYQQKGINQVICTDVEKDGLLQGPSFALYRDILREIPGIELIASGGVSSLNDLQELKETGVFGVIVGKAFYEGKISLEELAEFVTD